ncbi:hypothetical protein K503DRAFT_229300, partial [Rhizopogon vinicolor AM-OR11-026]
CSYARFISLLRCYACDRDLFVCQVYGNGWSSQCKRLITANALTFKSTIYPEWYVTSPFLSSLPQTKISPIPTDSLAPWVHYVLIQNAQTYMTYSR